MDSLRQRLQSNKCLNAFSDAFEITELQQVLNAAALAGLNSDDISAGATGPYFHQAYREFQKRAGTLIARQDLTAAEWETALLAHCNLTYLHSQQQGLAQVRQQIQDTGIFFSNSSI